MLNRKVCNPGDVHEASTSSQATIPIVPSRFHRSVSHRMQSASVQ